MASDAGLEQELKHGHFSSVLIIILNNPVLRNIVFHYVVFIYWLVIRPILPRCMECRRGLRWEFCPSVCPSVRPSDTWVV